MTSKQRISILAHRWPAACETQGWRRDDRDLRLAVIGEAIGREIKSLNDLDNAADIDRVFAHLGMLADDVKRTAETLPAGRVTVSTGGPRRSHNAIERTDTPGYRRRLLWLIKRDGHALGGEPYILALARDRFHITTGLTTITDLTTAQLHQLMMTLHARAVARERDERNAGYTPPATTAAPTPEPDLVPAGDIDDDNCPF